MCSELFPPIYSIYPRIQKPLKIWRRKLHFTESKAFSKSIFKIKPSTSPTPILCTTSLTIRTVSDIFLPFTNKNLSSEMILLITLPNLDANSLRIILSVLFIRLISLKFVTLTGLFVFEINAMNDEFNHTGRTLLL